MRTCHKLLRFTNCTHFHGTKWDSFFCECSNVNQNIKSTKIHKFWIKKFHQLFESDLIKNAEWKVILISQLKIGCFCCWFFFFQNVKNADEASFFSSDFYINLFGFCLVNVCNFIRFIFVNCRKCGKKKIQWKKNSWSKKNILCYRNKWWSSARVQIKLMK